jgi:hypothetical protein
VASPWRAGQTSTLAHLYHPPAHPTHAPAAFKAETREKNRKKAEQTKKRKQDKTPGAASPTAGACALQC